MAGRLLRNASSCQIRDRSAQPIARMAEVHDLRGSGGMHPRHPLARLLVTATVVAVAALAAWHAGWFDYHVIVANARALRAHSNVAVTAIAFVAAWAVATPLGFPALPLMIAGGALFGTMFGTALSMIGTVLGAVGGYLGARVLAPPRLRRWLARHLPMEELASGDHALRLVRMRLIPVLPFSAVNYAAGLAAVPTGTFIGTTLIGQLPSTLLYSYFADRLLEAATSGGDVARSVALFSAVLLLITLLPWVAHRLRGRRPQA